MKRILTYPIFVITPEGLCGYDPIGLILSKSVQGIISQPLTNKLYLYTNNN